MLKINSQNISSNILKNSRMFYCNNDLKNVLYNKFNNVIGFQVFA